MAHLSKAPFATGGYHNCFLAYNSCPITIKGRNLPENCAVNLPDYINKETGEMAKLVNVDCTSRKNEITGYLEAWPQNKIMEQVFYDQTHNTRINFDVVDEDQSNTVVSSTTITFREPKPSLTNDFSHNCFKEDNCPVFVEGYGFTQNMTVTGMLYYKGNLVNFENPIVKKVIYEMDATEYTHVMRVLLTDEATEYIHSKCEVVVDFIARNSQGKFLNTYFPGVLIEGWHNNEQQCIPEDERPVTSASPSTAVESSPISTAVAEETGEENTDVPASTTTTEETDAVTDDCTAENYTFNEADLGNQCRDDCQCDGQRTCNTQLALCEGTARPKTGPAAECDSIFYQFDEVDTYDNCQSACDCDGARYCQQGFCVGNRRF
eukprot:Pgem_evm1s20305